MTIKRANTDKKQTTPGPDSSNCNSLYGVFEICLGFIWMATVTAYAYLVRLPATLLLASVNLMNSNHMAASVCWL